MKFQNIVYSLILMGIANATDIGAEVHKNVEPIGSIRSATVEKIDDGIEIFGQLRLPEYGGLAWPKHYHVTINGTENQVLHEIIYRHGLSAPKSQKRLRGKPYRIRLSGISPEEVHSVTFIRVKKFHGFCEKTPVEARTL